MTSILQSYLQANRKVEAEYQHFELEIEEGAIPRELHGTLFRNGPGRL
ncbi:MAG: hypothetical protein GVY26_16835, partial [Bacteroidetes bacterium]|nr:hypothetical protein [Bacteroidota bacterium]